MPRLDSLALNKRELIADRGEWLAQLERPTRITRVRYEDLDCLARYVRQSRTDCIRLVLLTGWHHRHLHADAGGPDGAKTGRLREGRLKQLNHLRRYGTFNPKVTSHLSNCPIWTHQDTEWNELAMCQQHVLGESTRLVIEGIQIFGSHTTVLVLPATGMRQRECLAIRWSLSIASGDRIHRLTVCIRLVDDHPAALDEGLSVATRGLA